MLDNLTQEELKRNLNYDPNTGIFTHKIKNCNRVKIGNIAGYKKPDGYIVIQVNGIKYCAHRLAWLYLNGEFPKNYTDHINHIKHDNRITNLREANKSENGQNQKKAQKNNKLGLLGVSFYKKYNKYRAGIKLKGKYKTIGYFNTAEEAHKAYIEAKRQLHPYSTL